MSDWNLGSVASAVFVLIENVPTNISGTFILDLADRQRQYVADYTGTGIGSNSISISYQDVITKLTASEVASYMDTLGVDAAEMTLGDMTVKKGSDSSLEVVSRKFRESAEANLKALGRRTDYYKAYG